MTFQPRHIQGMVDLITPDGKTTSARLTIDRDRRRVQDGPPKPVVIIEIFDDNELGYTLPDLIMAGDLKAINLDLVVRPSNDVVLNQTIINGDGGPVSES